MSVCHSLTEILIYGENIWTIHEFLLLFEWQLRSHPCSIIPTWMHRLLILIPYCTHSGQNLYRICSNESWRMLNFSAIDERLSRVLCSTSVSKHVITSVFELERSDSTGCLMENPRPINHSAARLWCFLNWNDHHKDDFQLKRTSLMDCFIKSRMLVTQYLSIKITWQKSQWESALLDNLATLTQTSGNQIGKIKIVWLYLTLVVQCCCRMHNN